VEPPAPDLSGDPPAGLLVLDVPERDRYELRLDGDLAGLADYRRHDGVMTIPHVETAPEHRGRGFASLLMAGILDDVRARGERIRPQCPFAAAYLRDHPDEHDLLAD
jgi:hypothetical protein